MAIRICRENPGRFFQDFDANYESRALDRRTIIETAVSRPDLVWFSKVYVMPADTAFIESSQSRRTRYGTTRRAINYRNPVKNGFSFHRPGPGDFPGVRRPFRSLLWLIQVVIGVVFLLLLLSALAAFPILSLLTLGLMLQAEADVAANRRLRSGFPLLPISTRVGMTGLMVFLFLLPIIGLSTLANSQAVITQLSGQSERGMTVITRIFQVAIFLHLLMAIAYSGRFIAFFRPIRNFRSLRRDFKNGLLATRFESASDYCLQIVKPWHHFKIACYAAAGALCWLAIPVALLAVTPSAPRVDPGAPGAISILGGILFIPVAAWLPLLQCHQVVENRFMAIFEVRAIRKIISQVPIRWAIATILLYGLAIPLYLSKVVLPPADAFWMFTPLFIIVIYPTRLLMGWVYGTGRDKQKPAKRIIRWPIKLMMLPLLAFYAFLIFLLPFISEEGPRVMFENHAILLPVPSGQFNP